MKAKFWNNASGSLKIDHEALLIFLKDNGFWSYQPKQSNTKILIKVTDKKVRQVTLQKIREFLKVEPSDRIVFTPLEEGKVLITYKQSQVSNLFGMLQQSSRLFDTENALFAKYIAELRKLSVRYLGHDRFDQEIDKRIFFASILVRKCMCS